MTGDIEIIARVTAVENTHAAAKAGLMIRDALTPNAAHTSLYLTAANGAVLHERPLAGGPTLQVASAAASAPYWLRLERRAAVVTAFRSDDGVTWTLVGVATVVLPTIHVGLAVTSHNALAAATALFDNVIVRPPLPLTNLLPSISLISPPDNALFEEEVETILLSAGAADADGTVSRVDFYANDILLGSDTTSPFSYTWDDPADGTYVMTATATDDEGATTTSEPRTIERRRNRQPTTSLTAPADGATFTAPATVTMGATASDPDGTIARVEFYRDGTLVGTDTTSPYSVTWSNVPAGTYSLTSVAVDNRGKPGTSAARTITVTAAGNQPPTAALTAPAQNATFTAPASVMLTANASDPDGTITRVDFYRNGTLLGSDTTNSYSWTWNNVPAGTYSLTAVARDDDGATTTSAARTITVTAAANQPPTSALTAPAQGATFTAPASVTMTASAADTDGTIARVDFYQGTTVVGSDTTSPYSVTWSNVAAGTYSLTVVAQDNAGATTTSAARSITVTGTSLPAGWTGADIGQPAVAGSARHNTGTFTVEGAGTDIWDTSDQFQYVYRQVTGDIEIISRVVSLENTWEYAKAGVMIRETLAANAVHASLVVTPGHGTNFYRRLTPGATTQPGATGGPGAPYWVRLERRGSLITAFQSSDGVTWTSVGTMTLATATVYVGLAVTSVDVTQAATGVFDNVVVRPPVAGNQPPTASLTAPANGAAFTAPASVTMTATASDPDGTIAQVDFYRNGTLIGSDTTSPYGVTWNNVPAGTYSLTAVARDDDGATTTSAARTITVTAAANQPPTSALTAPAQGATFTAPASVTMTATASDSDGTIARVDFYQGTTVVGSDTTSPYSVTWSNVAAGTYSLTVVAQDNAGATTTSAARSITVTGTSLPAGWTGADIGQPAVAGSARHNTGTFTVEGAGTDIWDTSDQFQYVYRQVTGDIEIISRVVSLENTWEYAKAGVMIRETLAANAVHASLVVTPGHGTNFYRRLTPGATTQPGATGGPGAPYWVRLERRGSLITAFQSSDGVTWTSVGTMTLATATVYVGLAVTSVDVTQAATGVFDNVVVRPPVAGNQPPTASLTAPANGAAFTAPASVTMTATASDPDGTIAQVDFYRNGTLIGSDTTSPYSVTWNNVPAGTYSLTAVARDDDGATTTSAARTITVGNPSSSRRAVFVASSNHNTAVTRYVLEIFTSGANPNTATPVATRDLGKPPVVSGECDVDVASTINSLPPGQYIATVTAVGSGGSARSAPSAAFNR